MLLFESGCPLARNLRDIEIPGFLRLRGTTATRRIAIVIRSHPLVEPQEVSNLGAV